MKYINPAIKWICALCLAVMVILVVINTLLRYAFSSSIVQTEELCRYLFMWTVYLAAITVWDEKGHICVTILTARLKGMSARVLRGVVALLSLYALGMLFYGSVQYWLETTMIGQVTYIPYRMMILPVLLGALGCAVLIVRDFLQTPPSAATAAPGDGSGKAEG